MPIRPRTRYSEEITGSEPVTELELSSWLKGNSDPSENAILCMIIKAAREQIESYCKISIVQRTVTFYMDAWPTQRTDRANEDWWSGVRQGAIQDLYSSSPFYELPKPPVQSVTSIAGMGDDDTPVIWDSGNYFLDNIETSQPARIAPRIAATWPTFDRPIDGIRTIYVAGFANGSVPAGLKLAILGVAAYMYVHRGDCGDCMEACGMAVKLRDYMVMNSP